MHYHGNSSFISRVENTNQGQISRAELLKSSAINLLLCLPSMSDLVQELHNPFFMLTKDVRAFRKGTSQYSRRYSGCLPDEALRCLKNFNYHMLARAIPTKGRLGAWQRPRIYGLHRTRIFSSLGTARKTPAKRPVPSKICTKISCKNRMADVP